MLFIDPDVSRYKILIYLLLFFTYLSSSPISTFGAEQEEIQYINSNSEKLKAHLLPAPSNGQVPYTEKTLVKVNVDNKNTSFSLTKGPKGTAKVTGNLPDSLKESSHKATVTTLTPSSEQKDQEEILFVYDKTPPKIELIYPNEGEDQIYTDSTFLFRIHEDGSGIDTNPDNSLEEAKIANSGIAGAGYTLSGSDLILILQSKKASHVESGKQTEINVKVRDRAGNIGSYTQTVSNRELEQKISKVCKSNGDGHYVFDSGSIIALVQERPTNLQINKPAPLYLEIGPAISRNNSEKIYCTAWDYHGYDQNDFGLCDAENSDISEAVKNNVTISSSSPYLRVRKVSETPRQFPSESFLAIVLHPATITLPMKSNKLH